MNCAKEEPLVSIIVPAYNTSKYLHQCMDSIIAQTYLNIEVILINDGSTDDTGEICDFYAQQYDFVKTIHQTNQGQAAARNKGIKASRGEWISFVDSDDAIHPHMIEVLLMGAMKENARMCSCTFNKVNEMPEEFPNIQQPQFQCIRVDEEGIYHERFDVWCITAKVIDRRIIEKKILTSGRIFEDNAIALFWLSDAGSVVVTKYPLYYYRMNQEGTTQKPFSVKKLDFLWALEQRSEFCVLNKYRNYLCKTLISYIFNTRDMCREIKGRGDIALARSVKYHSMRFVLRKIRYTTNKSGVLLRLVKTWLLY